VPHTVCAGPAHVLGRGKNIDDNITTLVYKRLGVHLRVKRKKRGGRRLKQQEGGKKKMRTVSYVFDDGTAVVPGDNRVVKSCRAEPQMSSGCGV
jgi:hypothetical protein